MEILKFLFLLLFLNSVSSQGWKDPYLTLNQAAQDKAVKFDRNTLTLSIPEKAWVPDGFELGNLVYDGDFVVVEKCFGLDKPGVTFDGVFPEGVNQGDPFVLKKGLDYELDIKANDIEGIHCNFKINDLVCPDHPDACRDLTINIRNVNNREPVWVTQPQQQSLSIEENTENQKFAFFNASDPDLLGPISYKVTSFDGSDVSDKFQFHQEDDTSAFLEVKHLDYEDQFSFQLTITAMDAPDEFGNIKELKFVLEVNVDDVQDTPPNWKKQPPGNYKLSEDSQIGLELFTILAIDGDLGVTPQRKISYEITDILYEGSSVDSFLSIDPDGVVKLAQVVDRESFGDDDSFTVVFVATEEDCQNDCKSENATSIIRIIDVNDNGPTIKADTPNIEMEENSQGIQEIFGVINVDDKDPSSQFSTFLLTLAGEPNLTNYLKVQPETGIGNTQVLMKIVDSKHEFFDREIRETIKFELIATDKDDNSKTAVQEFVITLKDVNDETPKFSEKNYFLEVFEDLSNLNMFEEGVYELLTVSATDNDISDEFGSKSLQFSITSSQNLPIEIDPETGIITLKTSDPLSVFDFESLEKHEIKLLVQDCRDCNDPDSTFQTDTSTLTLTIIDVNDRSPLVDIDLTSACTFENDPVMWPQGSSLCQEENFISNITITANDVDNDANLILEIDWDLTEARKDYQVVSKNDYDYTQCFKLTTEGGPSQLTAYIEEDVEFIDREKVDTIDFKIRAIDTQTVHGQNATTVTLSLSIKDLDDTSPRFVDNLDNLKFEIDEDAENKTPGYVGVLLPISIRVDDDDLVKSFTFKLKGNAVSEGYFDIVSDGPEAREAKLKVKKSIDREALVSTNGNLTYTVVVSDPAGQETEKQIVVQVNDLNDCKPVFDPPTYNISINENTEVNKSILNVSATDNDVTLAYNTIFYKPLESEVPFRINKNTGEITVDRTLDYDNTPTKVYNIKVIAADNEQGFQNTEVGTVIVNLEDYNDNAPILDNGQINVKISNVFSIEAPIITYTATDADSGINKQLIFSSPDIDSLFKVEENGQLHALKPLTEIHNTFYFNLTVEDKGVPKLSSSMTCAIEVEDKNDKTPVFTFPTSTDNSVFVDQNSTVGSVLVSISGSRVTLKATDEDGFFEYSKVNYAYDKGASETLKKLFEINPNSGDIKLLQSLAETEEITFELPVKAFDNPGDLSNSLSVTGVLIIKSTRNEQPVFENNDPLTFSFTEESLTESAMLPKAIDVEDNIEGEDDPICFHIMDDEGLPFQVGLRSGNLTLKEALDREVLDHFNFVVITSNNCKDKPGSIDEVKPKSRVSVNIKVEDINDVVPKFVTSPMFFIISVNQTGVWEKDILVKDDDLNEDLTCSIVDQIYTSEDSQGLENIPNPFIVDKISSTQNKLSANFNPNPTMKGYFYFKMAVNDKDDVHETEVDVKIVVIGVENQVKVTFDKPTNFINQISANITNVFEVTFSGWLFNIDSVRPKVRAADEEKAVMSCSFIDNKSYLPINKIDAQARFDSVYGDLVAGLAGLGVALDKTEGFDVGGNDPGVSNPLSIPQGLSLASIFIVFILLVVVLFLGVAYRIRVSGLERRIFVSTISQKNPDLGQQQDDLPGTNFNAEKGANPVWDPNAQPDGPGGARLTDLDLRGATNTRREVDGYESDGSGGSIFIGVEDDEDFRGYRGRQEDDIESELSDVENFDKARPPPPRRRGHNISVFLRPAYEDNQVVRQNPLYNDMDETIL